jgi:hypothetical protein
MSLIEKSWRKFIIDVSETLGGGAIPFAILVQCFKRKHPGWQILGFLLMPLMIPLGIVTLLIATIFSLIQLVFVPLRILASGIQDLITDEDFDIGEFGEERISLASPKTAKYLSIEKSKIDIKETMQAGFIPFYLIKKAGSEGGFFLLTIPFLAVIGLGTILFAAVLTTLQLLFLPVRKLSSTIQDFISPSLLDIEVGGIPSGMYYARPTISLRPPRERQFMYVRPVKIKPKNIDNEDSAEKENQAIKCA